MISMIGTAPSANRKCELSAIRASDARSNARTYGSVRTRRSSFSSWDVARRDRETMVARYGALYDELLEARAS